jgi:hypothetical protein
LRGAGRAPATINRPGARSAPRLFVRSFTQANPRNKMHAPHEAQIPPRERKNIRARNPRGRESSRGFMRIPCIYKDLICHAQSARINRSHTSRLGHLSPVPRCPILVLIFWCNSAAVRLSGMFRASPQYSS